MPDRPADLGGLLRVHAAALAEVGIATGRGEVEELAGVVLGVDRSRVRHLALVGTDLTIDQTERLADLVRARRARVPLQHLTGRAHFRHLSLQVGPGVFVPRPETEVLVDLALADLTRLATESRPTPLRVFDLCTGSGAIALAIATECPGARVTAVELSAEAHAWAARNVAEQSMDADLPVDVVWGPAQDAGADELGAVDLVVSNPPYIPSGMVPRDIEVAEHDPALALYGGGVDGLEIPREVAARAAQLLRPGGVFLMEHAETQGESLVAELTAAGAWEQVADHADLTGRPRVLRAVRR